MLTKDMNGALDRTPQHSSFNEDFELFWDGLKAIEDQSTKSGFRLNPDEQHINELLPVPPGQAIHGIKIYDPENDKAYKNLMWVSGSLVPENIRTMLKSNGKRYHLKTSHGRSFTPDKISEGRFGNERWEEVIDWRNQRAGLKVKPWPIVSRLLGL